MVSLDFPHPKEYSVVKSPTLLLRAYLIQYGSADELKTRAVSHMQSGTEGLSADSPFQDRRVYFRACIVVKTRALIPAIVDANVVVALALDLVTASPPHTKHGGGTHV